MCKIEGCACPGLNDAGVEAGHAINDILRQVTVEDRVSLASSMLVNAVVFDGATLLELCEWAEAGIARLMQMQEEEDAIHESGVTH